MIGSNVLNVDECNIDTVSWTFNKIRGSYKWQTSEKLEIRHVQIIQDNTQKSAGGMTSQICGSVVASSISGLLGLLTYAGRGPHSIDIDLDIYLTDGRVIEINTQDKKLVKQLIPYMHTADPRAKYRKLRGK